MVLFLVPPLLAPLGLEPPVSSAGGVQTQRDATSCEAVGNNWTSCENAASSDNVYAEANNGPRGPQQFARPASDLQTGSWTPAPLWQQLNEATRNDGEYVTSPLDPVSPTNDVEIGQSSVIDPETDSGHAVRYTYRKNGSGDGRADLAVKLLQGATEVASWSHPNMSSTWTQQNQTLTAVQAASITDYSDLRIQYEPAMAKGLLAYGEGVVAAPRNRLWDGGSFGAEASAQDAAPTIQWVVAKASPTDPEEKILGVLASNNLLYIQTWNGTSWTLNWNANLGGSVTRAFDIAFEASSGDAMVVFGDATSQLKYRKRVGGTWDASDQSAGVPLSDLPFWVKAEPRPITDDIFVAAVTNAQELHALRWIGASNAWGDQIQTATRPAVKDQEAFDIAFERASGDAFLIWGAQDSTLKSKEFTTSWQPTLTAYALPDRAHWVVADHDPRPASGRIAVGMVLNDGNFEFGAWNGTLWVTRPAPVLAWEQTERGIDVQFENDTGKAVYVFATFANPDRLSWRDWTVSGGFSAPTTEAGASGAINTVQLRADRASNAMMALYGDASSALFHRRWNGSSWSSLSAALETSLSASPLREAFMFAWNRGGKVHWSWAEVEVPGTIPIGKNDTAWGSFGYNLDPLATIERVEVGVEWFRISAEPILAVTVSWDGGLGWAANRTASNKSADDNTLEWLNFTSATAWDVSKLSDANLRVRVGTNASGARLDYVTIRVTHNSAPRISNFRLEDGIGQSKAGERLDVDTTYHFLFNATDPDGWSDIGMDGSISLRLWYDGNGTPELTYGEQTSGGDYRVELTYVDVSDPDNLTLGEWSVTEGSATYNASASSLTAILSGPTLIGYEFNLAMKLGFHVKAAIDPINSSVGSYNDRDSWNAEIVASDGDDNTTLQIVSTGEHMEFGVVERALLEYSATPSPSTLQPGEFTVFQVNFTNSGQGTAGAVWVNMTLPAELTYVSDDAGAIGGVRSGAFSFEFGNVSPGSYAFNVTASANGGVANGTVATTNMTFEATDLAGAPLNLTAQDVPITIGNAMLSQSVTPSVPALGPGQPVVFQVNFTNSGPGKAGSLWVNVTLAANLTYLSDDAALIGGVRSGAYSFTFVNVTTGDYSFNLTASAMGGVANGTVAVTNFTLEAVDPLGWPLTPSVQGVALTITNAAVDLSLSATASVADPGDTIVLNGTVANIGVEPAANVVIEAPIDANVTYLTSSPLGAYDAAARAVRWNLSSLDPGVPFVFSWTVEVRPGTPDDAMLPSLVRVEYQDTTGTPLPSEEAGTIARVRAPAFAPVLEVTQSAAERGDEVGATLYYNNSGSGVALRAWANWSLNGHFELIELVPSLPYTLSSEGFSVSPSNVAPGAHSLEARLRVIRGMADGLAMDMRVEWAAADANGNPLPETALPASVSLRAPVVTLSLASSSPRVASDSLFSLNLTIRNVGQATATGWLNLTVPAGVRYVKDNRTFAVTTVDGSVSWRIPSFPADSVLYLGVDLVAGGGRGVEAFRFAFTHTDGKGSLPQAVFSNAVSVELLPATSILLGLPWWSLVLLAAAIPGAAYPLIRRWQSRRVRIEEVFVVDSGGKLLAHMSASIIQSKDEDLVVAMFTAIQEYVRNVFSRGPKEEIRKLEFGERTILVEGGHEHWIAVVYRGQDHGEIEGRVRAASREIDRRFAADLAEWGGDVEEVQDIASVLPPIWGDKE